MRLDSPAVLATVGTLAIHVLIAMLGDVLLQSIPPPKQDPPTKLQLVRIWAGDELSARRRARRTG